MSSENVTSVKKQCPKKKINQNWDSFRKINNSQCLPARNLPAPKISPRAKNVIAIDCEMVGVGLDGKESALARISLVDYDLKVVYDSYVKPTEAVTDYRTAVSGIERRHLVNAKEFHVVQREVFELLKTNILVGHALWHDLKVLQLKHSKKRIRDTSLYPKCMAVTKGIKPSLKNLAAYFFNKDIQGGQHDSVEDARITMMIYKKFQNEWEASLRVKKH